MDGLRLPSYGKEFQKDDGLSRSLDSGSDPQWIEVCHPTGGGVVTWARTPAQTSNYGRITLREKLAGQIDTSTTIDVMFSNGAFTGSDGHPIELKKRNIARYLDR